MNCLVLKMGSNRTISGRTERLHSKFQQYVTAVIKTIIELDVPSVKDVLKAHLLQAEYVVDTQEYDVRRRSDLFIGQIISFITSGKCIM